jgi:hypothetical protein
MRRATITSYPVISVTHLLTPAGVRNFIGDLKSSSWSAHRSVDGFSSGEVLQLGTASAPDKKTQVMLKEQKCCGPTTARCTLQT